MGQAPWHPHQQQTVALATLLGVLLGTLRAKGTLADEEQEMVLQLADHLLPEPATEQGSLLLATVRAVAGQVRGEPG